MGPVQLAYFSGYAMWTHLTVPFSFATPGFHTEELSPWQEDGQTWRRLKVEFPDHIATHRKEQTFYFDSHGLLKRHDYAPEVSGPGTAARYITEHREFDGVIVPPRPGST